MGSLQVLHRFWLNAYNEIMMKHANNELVGKLRANAAQASENAYSPYSQYKVGAAVINDRGEIFAGCNMENASFGLTQCAERNAIAGAISAGSRVGSLSMLVIYIPGELALPPCGACRQVMYEMMASDSEVIACCDSDDIKAWTRDQNLPDPFNFQDYP